MFLQDQDLQSNVNITDLQAKLAQIQSFTTALFADIDDSERERHESIKNRFEQLKTTLLVILMKSYARRKVILATNKKPCEKRNSI